MAEQPVDKKKRSKRVLESSTDNSEASSSSNPNPNITSSTSSLGGGNGAPQIVVQNADALVPTGEASKSSKRKDKSSATASSSQSTEKPKDKSKDRERKRLSKETSASSPTNPVVVGQAITTVASATQDNPVLHEGVIYKHAGRFKGWKKRTFKLKRNGDLDYFHKSRLRGSFSVLSSVILLSRSDACRCEIDTGRVVLHLRTLRASDRDIWIEKIAQIQATPKRPEDSITAAIEVKIQTLNKNITLAKSLETILNNRLDMIKPDSKMPTMVEGVVAPSVDAGGAIVHEEHHHKKKRHSRTKSEDVHASLTYYQQSQEIQRTISQLMGAIEGISKEMSEAVQSIAATAGAASSLMMPSGGRGKMRSISGVNEEATGEPMILYGDDSNSDSEDYFDAEFNSDGEMESDDDEEDSSSSSTEYFDSNKPLQNSGHSKTGSVTGDPQANRATSSNALTSSRPGTPTANKNKDSRKAAKKQSKRLSRGLKLETQASLIRAPTMAAVNMKETFEKMPAGWKPRTALPFDKPKGGNLNLMKILKDAIGKDITRITIPVQYSEPINMLQRLVEDFEYGEILLMAAAEENVVKRLLYIAAFASSSYASIYVRRTKPFNPLLGETFEYIDAEKQYRLLTEQVSHHPPISAFTVDSPGYSMWGHAHAKTKFWGKSLEINPTGQISLRLNKWNEVYTWNKITTCMNNVLVGSKWIDNYGDLSVFNQTTGHKVLLDFKKRGWFDANAYKIVGSAYSPDNVVTHRIEGFWNDYLAAHPLGPDGTEGPAIQIWKRVPLPDHAEKQYCFTSYTMRLNELADWMKPLLAPTDSRLRPDQRALENCDIDVAQSEKARLEDKQRAARKRLEDGGQEYSPVWFNKGDGDAWVYKGGYWEARSAGNWPSAVPDLF